MHAEFVQQVARIGQHIDQVRDRRALVAGHVGHASLQQGLGDREDALAEEGLALAEAQPRAKDQAWAPAACEEPRRDWRARPRSPSPRYDSSRDSSPRSPMCRRFGRWEEPPAPVVHLPPARNVRFSRSPSPPRRSRSPRAEAAYNAYEARDAPRSGIRPPLRSAPINDERRLAPLMAPQQREHAAASAPIGHVAPMPMREMPMLRHGRVARYVAKSRYGFIVDAADPSAPDLFVNSASLALGCREVDTLRVGAYVTFRSDSRLVNGCVASRMRCDVLPANARGCAG
jgi:hypothetical protein